MINKKVANIKEALKGVTNNMTFMFGGFGLSGIPENAIQAVVASKINSPYGCDSKKNVFIRFTPK